MIDLTPRGSALDLSHTTTRRQQAITNLASGSREDLRFKDSGSFSMNARLNGHVAVERKLLQNMQSLVSYSELQDGKLDDMAKLVNRMSELASMSTDVIQTDSDRSNYNREFLNLVDQFGDIQNTTFNGIKLFGNGLSEEGQRFLDSLKNHWLKASEDLIQEQYAWDPYPSDSWDLVVEESDTGGWAAFVLSTRPSSGRGDVVTMSFDLPDFSAPHTQPQSTADATVAHEMVHLMHAHNSQWGNLTGDNKEANWFREGLAEFIAGADSRVVGDLTSLTGQSSFASNAAYETALVGQISNLVNKIGNGNEKWSDSKQYSAAYLAVRYLHEEIKGTTAGDVTLNVNGSPVTVTTADGIKHMTAWMRKEMEAGNAAGINNYFGISNGVGGTNDSFLADFKGTNGQNFVQGLIEGGTPAVPLDGKLFNTDTGSIRGSDVGGALALDEQDAVLDATGSPQGSYVVDDSSEPITMASSGDGDKSTLNPISPITFGDTSTCNLFSVESATLTMEYLESLMESIATLRATVGGNMSVTRNNFDALTHRTTALSQSISRTGDTSIEDESLALAKTAILQQMNISMRVQAN